MATSATCGSCGLRAPLIDFPVAKYDKLRRVAAVCIKCLRSIYPAFEQVLDVRPATTEEDSLLEREQTLKRTRSNGGTDPRKKRGRMSDLPVPTTPTCRICFEDKDLKHFPRWRRRDSPAMPTEMPPKCLLGLHAKAGPVCKACIGRSLTAALKAKGSTRRRCFECRQAWSAKHVRMYFSDDMFVRYLDDLLKVKIVSRANFMWCPNRRCGSGGLTLKLSAGWPQVECATCKARACAQCKTPWHQSMSCQLYQATRSYGEGEVENLERLEALGVKMCMNCGVVVEKIGGCPHMWCQLCNTRFDWNRTEPVVALNSLAKKTLHVAQSVVAVHKGECEADAIKQEAPELKAEADAEVDLPAPVKTTRAKPEASGFLSLGF